VLLDKKSQKMIENELLIKHREQRDNNRKLKKKYIDTINTLYYLRLPSQDIDNSELWKIIENISSTKTTYISGRSCIKCGNYGYIKENNGQLNSNKKYPPYILCKCE
jgi:hypothetical protein